MVKVLPHSFSSAAIKTIKLKTGESPGPVTRPAVYRDKSRVYFHLPSGGSIIREFSEIPPKGLDLDCNRKDDGHFVTGWLDQNLQGRQSWVDYRTRENWEILVMPGTKLKD